MSDPKCARVMLQAAERDALTLVEALVQEVQDRLAMVE